MPVKQLPPAKVKKARDARRRNKPTIRELRRLQDAYVPPEFAGRCFDMGRTATYDAIRRGEFPVPVIKRGRHIIVPTVPLLRALGIEPDAGRRAS